MDIIERLRLLGRETISGDDSITWKAADEIERLREALIHADLKIRSYPGADQSDVEFIRNTLGG